jgi:hypothetical protein
MVKKIVKINRAPVLTLWAAVVTERLGYDHGTALTLGKAVAGLNAQSKGQRLGIYEKPKDKPAKGRQKTTTEEPRPQVLVTVLGRAVPTVRTKDGIRALAKGVPINPQSVQRYLDLKFLEDLSDVQDAMEALAKSYKPERLADEAYSLYEHFRPTVPEGEKGWGAKGDLDLGKIRSLGK